MDKAEIKKRVTYHPPTKEAIAAHEEVREAIEMAMAKLTAFVPAGREQSLAITNLEQAMFWANAGVARNHDKLVQ